MKRTVLLFAAALALLSSPIYAQTPEPTVSYTVSIFASGVANPGDTNPVGTPVTYTLAQTVCGQAKVPPVTVPPNVVNPRALVFDDPANPINMDCRIDISSQINALPIGNGYRAAAKANGATTVSDFSAWAIPSFDRAVVRPPVPANIRILR